MTTVVLLGHGSRDPRASQAMCDFAEALQNRLLGVTVRVAFLAHNEPTLQKAIDELPPADLRVIVVPMLLASAFHAKHDMPATVAALQTQRNVVTTKPIGSLGLAASASSALQGPILLAFSGTSDPDALRELEALADDLALQRGTPVHVGYASQAESDLATVIAATGARSVLCYTIFPGVFTNRIRQAAAAAGIPCTPPLWQHGPFADAVAEVVSDGLG